MDCSKIDKYIEPLFNNRLSAEEAISIKNHILSCDRCYSKLSEEYKISLELYAMPRIKTGISTADIMSSLKQHDSFNIISYNTPPKSRVIAYLKVALYILLLLTSVFLLLGKNRGIASSNKSLQTKAYMESYKHPNILKIDNIQVVNEIMPYYRESSLAKNASSEDIF